MIIELLRQDGRETDQGSAVQVLSEKLGRLSTDESLTDWHLGFHIYLVRSLPRLLPILQFSYSTITAFRSSCSNLNLNWISMAFLTSL